MRTLVLFLAFLGFNTTAHAQTSAYLAVGTLQVHHAVFEPESAPIGDVLFLHGYGDSFQNHRPLFEKFNQRGLRVIGFDYPSHGETHGRFWDDLDNHSFGSLTRIAALVLNQYRRDSSRPLTIVGWSTGGLHAIRIAQKPDWRRAFPGLSGLILYAPGVSVKMCVGNEFCHITNETLNHDVTLNSREIEPGSPLYRAKFATRLLFNSWLSWRQPVPANLPILLFVGSENDRYVNTNEIKKWTHLQRMTFNANIVAIQCASARHELDNELPSFGGAFVQTQSSQFAHAIALKMTLPSAPLGCPCEAF